MKPLIVIEVTGDPKEDDRGNKFDDWIIDYELSRDYEILVMWGEPPPKIRVYYPNRPLSFYYHKLRTWVIRKMLRRKLSSIISKVK